VSTATAPTTAGTQPVFRSGAIPRAVSAFSGSTGYAVKIAFLCASNALAVWALYVLVDRSHWIAAALIAASTAAIDLVYLSPKASVMPLKFMIPGLVFLIAFQIIPVIYTVAVAFTNYSTGHVLTKPDAIRQIQTTSLQAPPNGGQYDMAPARDASGNLVMILHDPSTGKDYVGTKKGLTPLPSSTVKIGALGVTSATGYKLIKGAALFSLDQQLQSYDIPIKGGKAAIQPQGVSQAVELEPTLRYDPKRDVFVRISDGTVFRDNGRGSFVAANNPANELEPGWKAGIGFRNFSKILHDPIVRSPFISVFVFTFVFAAATVFLSFAVGLFLAIALDKRGMRFQRFYRTAVVIPYAMPGFVSILVWAGLLNDDFGVVNRLFHTHVPWLFGGNMARVTVILVSVWLTTPYFFLVSMGALQSIPADLYEAARVDGGGGWQIFRRVTLPLLLVAVAPLMIASFAFNFNNFNTIYLLTQGGPYTGTSSIAGNTDILISYTYKLAIASGKGSDYALASTVAIIIFFIVAGISGIAFWRTKSLETLA
jgi:arabinogalactan oligomer/maltooligosaccharide transport system permease protein